MLIYKPEGRLNFTEIMTRLRDNAISYSNTKVGAILKTLAPGGQNIIIKTNEGTRYYKLDWRDDYGTHGKPFQL